MNCDRARELVSPYLDQELTGAEMLEMRQHLERCGACAREYEAVRQVKFLLRSLTPQDPIRSVEQRIVAQLDRETATPELVRIWAGPSGHVPSVLAAFQRARLPTRPQRGRRLATALALSCVVLFTVAAPFAPPAADSGNTRATSASALGQTLFWQRTSPVGWHDPHWHVASGVTAVMPRSVVVTGSVTAPGSAAFLPQDRLLSPTPPAGTVVGQYAQTPLAALDAEPLGDEAVNGYVSGDIAMAGFRTR